ncbi:flagellar export chaperone FlgN [Mucisphaera sp.]|uniref:flagellar export chaperone FlgN n=1 Tax=Mucisphaera sp. TaxID=2913024 RepID=UPI003D0D0765
MDERSLRLLSELEALLTQMIERQRLWLAVFEQKTEALRQGDQAMMAALSTQESDHLRAMSEYEKRRLHLLAALTQILEPGASEPMRLAAMAERLPAPIRDRLLILRSNLRHEIERFKTRLASVSQASNTLMRHVNGVVETVVAAASGHGTYAQPGRKGQPVAATLSTFSLTA